MGIEDFFNEKIAEDTEVTTPVEPDVEEDYSAESDGFIKLLDNKLNEVFGSKEAAADPGVKDEPKPKIKDEPKPEIKDEPKPEVNQVDEFLKEHYGTSDIEAIRAKQQVETQKAARQRDIEIAYKADVSEINLLWKDAQLRYQTGAISEEELAETKLDLEAALDKINESRVKAEQHHVAPVEQAYAAQQSQNEFNRSIDNYVSSLKEVKNVPKAFVETALKLVEEMKQEVLDPKMQNIGIDELLKKREDQMARVFKAGMEHQKSTEQNSRTVEQAKSRLATLATKSSSGASRGSSKLTQAEISRMSEAERNKRLPEIMEFYLD